MGMIWTSRTRTRQPQGAVGVNWGNPSSRALAVAVSGANPGINLVNGRDAVAYNAVQRTATQVGTGLTWPSTSNTGVQIGPGSLLPGSAGNYTSGMTLILLANPSASTTRTLPLSLSSGAQPTVYVGFNANKALTATSGMLMVQTHGNNGAQAASVIDGKWHVFAVVFPEGSALPLLYVDGVHVTASSSGSASTYANAAANVYVGGFSSSGFSATGYAIALALGFNRGIPAEEMAELSRNPWQLFTPEQTPKFYSLPAASGSGMIRTSKTRTKQPSAPVGLAQNELTKSVIFAAPLGYDNRDVVSRTRLTLGAGYTTGADERGLSGKSAGSSAFASFPLNLSAYTKLTVSFWMYWNGYANDDDMAMEFGSPAFTTNGFFINPNSGVPTSGLFQVAMGASALSSAGSFVRPSAGVWHHYMVGLDRTQGASAGITMYVDGLSQTYTHIGSSSDIPDNFANSTLYIFGRNNASLFGAGRMQNLLIRGQVLPTDSLALAEYRNPWQLFAPSRTPSFYSISSSGGGAGTKILIPFRRVWTRQPR